MVDEGLVRFVSTLGVGGAVAALIFLAYRKDVSLFTNGWKGQAEMLMQVVKENTAAITSNTATGSALLDRLTAYDLEMREVLDRVAQIATINRTELDSLRIEIDRRLTDAVERRVADRLAHRLHT